MRRAAFVTVAFLALLLSGCGPSESRETSLGEPTTFSPVPELSAYTEVATVRVARATGRDDVTAEPGGIPVIFQEELLSKDGQPACGLTLGKSYPNTPDEVFDLSVLVDPTPPPGCPPVHITVLHEMIHALSPGAEHSEAGVFHAHGAGALLEETSLTALCAGFECLAFAPEGDR